MPYLSKSKFFSYYLPFILSAVLLATAGFFWLTLNAPIAQAGYSYSRTITVNTGQVSGTQTNFPMLFSGTYSYLATVANGGLVTNANGYDIIFTSDSACATKLNFEQELYTAATGVVSYWINIASITDGTVIYLCYGNSAISTDQSNATAIWDSNFKGVWHLPNGTTLTANDSIASGHNGTVTGAVAVAGQIDGSGSFDAAGDYISFASFDLATANTLTFSAWIKPNSSADLSGTRYTVWSPDDTAGQFQVEIGYANNNPFGIAVIIPGLYVATTLNHELSVNVWQHIVYTRSGAGAGTHKLYVNGVSKTLGTDDATNFSDGASTKSIGSRYSGGGGQLFYGSLDEIRISNTNRSAAWITTEYNNQSAPGSFYAVGGQVASTKTGNFAQQGGKFLQKGGKVIIK